MAGLFEGESTSSSSEEEDLSEERGLYFGYPPSESEETESDMDGDTDATLESNHNSGIIQYVYFILTLIMSSVKFDNMSISRLKYGAIHLLVIGYIMHSIPNLSSYLKHLSHKGVLCLHYSIYIYTVTSNAVHFTAGFFVICPIFAVAQAYLHSCPSCHVWDKAANCRLYLSPSMYNTFFVIKQLE